jgi:N-acetylmuramoyl-L-alanine amidase
VRARRLIGLTVIAIAAAVGWRIGAELASAGSTGSALDSAVFARGACEAFGPTAGDRGMTVFLDAGHGGPDPGGVGVTETGRTVREADATLRVELDAMALLRAVGFRVVVSRTSDTTVLRLRASDVSDGLLSAQGVHDDVAARDVCANLSGARALVGIYFDASSSPQTAGSLSAYDAARPFATANLQLATLLQRDVLATMNAHGWEIPDDGVVSDSGLGSSVGDPASGGLAAQAAAYDHLLLIGPPVAGYFSTPSAMPGAVIEPLYLTDPFEGSIADTSVGQESIARGIAGALEQFLRGQTATA